jgi:hypothetical protein
MRREHKEILCARVGYSTVCDSRSALPLGAVAEIATALFLVSCLWCVYCSVRVRDYFRLTYPEKWRVLQLPDSIWDRSTRERNILSNNSLFWRYLRDESPRLSDPHLQSLLTARTRAFWVSAAAAIAVFVAWAYEDSTAPNNHWRGP